MLERIIERLETLPFTIIAGVALLMDLVPHLTGTPTVFHFSYISAIICGVPIIYSAIRKLICNRGIKRISSALLISIAMVCAVAIGDIFAAGEVAFIMAIGELLEERTTKRARAGLKKLIDLTPKTARRVTDNGDEIIAQAEVRVDDVVRILAGEAIPADGVIIRGETSVDESIMTGEAMPVDKAVGDNVYCGTINRFGVILVRIAHEARDSSLQRLIEMVKCAEGKKAPTERIADRWASILVPVALTLAAVAGIVKQDIVVAVTILVVFCPCALVLATPTAIMAAIGQATRHGIIIKSGEALEAMGRIDTVAFDKTGTITTGKLSVSDIIPNLCDADTLLTLVASAESVSEHPLGKAVTEFAHKTGVNVTEPTEFSMVLGRGISATVGDVTVHCGNMRYIAERGITLGDDLEIALKKLQREGKAAIIAATDCEVLGIITLSDTLRPNTREAITKLCDAGAKTVMLTGDNADAARYFGEMAGVSDVFSELLPEDKVARLEALQGDGRRVAMIGDGINDAPALAVADCGIAMGNMGSDIAVDAADITLIGDDLTKVAYLKRLAKATVGTIRFGITLSLAINLVGIVLSFMQILTPVTGALVHNAGSVLVVLIAALLYDRKF